MPLFRIIEVFNVLFPLFTVIGIGFWAGHRKIIAQNQASQFASYVINISFPCLLILQISSAPLEALLDFQYMLVCSLTLIGTYLLVLFLQRSILKHGLAESCQTALLCSYPNMAFMGIPIFSWLFGGDSLLCIVIGSLIVNLCIIPLTITMLEISAGRKAKLNYSATFIRVLCRPLTIAAFLGIICAICKIQLPMFIQKPLKIIGTTTSGVALFTLGLLVSQAHFHCSRKVLFNVFTKNIAQPVFATVIASIFGITGVCRQEVVFLCALPSAITATMFATKYDVCKAEASSGAILSTLLSSVVIGCLMLYWL